MNLYIDCEWNDYKGDLISMALVAQDGEEFYEVLECPNPSPRIAENVIPVLGKAPVSYQEFQRKLANFLGQWSMVHLIADWPKDVAHFYNALIIGLGSMVGKPRLIIQISSVNYQSKNPHNALADARALKEVYGTVLCKRTQPSQTS